MVLFVGQSLSNRRKGAWLLPEVFQNLAGIRGFHLLSVGETSKTVFPVQYTSLGTLTHEGMLSLAYNAADLLVMPSLLDNLPCTVMESLACGTPVVAFDVGGVGDLVKDGRNGRLVRVGDTEVLADAIRNVLQDDRKREGMGKYARKDAEERFSPEKQAGRYMDIAQSMIVSRARDAHV